MVVLFYRRSEASYDRVAGHFCCLRCGSNRPHDDGAAGVRSPANARRLLKAYENALNSIHVAEHELLDPDSTDTL